ncbi:MAG TPA: SdrD B-like domain-containing protein [Aquabacterium sp.]|uniref:SdrD B-like domain-containing protein n=1 Tax=Aquabacterium sp. TaxID=1872578 RepID=UPI002E305553|nr:SdrD B-like domain-containing protein [Aquabacterium sp.]HEX5371806.1 SdrD B-like domain-containing protein [Aquabacterium sp.]
MSDITVQSVVHVCEDTNQTFKLVDLLNQAGYYPVQPIELLGAFVIENGEPVEAPTALFRTVGTDSVEVTAAAVANYNGSFDTLTLIIDTGFNVVTLNLQVVVDPVNDAPSGADASIALVDGSPYVLTESSFGFTDAIDGHHLQSVLISTLPTTGALLLNGVALTTPTEVSAADIAAGKLSFQPAVGSSGQVSFGFQVRDDGGLAGCNAADLDATPNTITFSIPTSSLGDRVWLDANGNGVQDGTESGLAGVSVTLIGAGLDNTFGTADDTSTSTTTNASGDYLFNQLVSGLYRVQAGALAGYNFTGQDAGGNDATDSDVNSSGLSDTIALGVGEHNSSVDIGLQQQATGSIGNRVWKDSDCDGLQDSCEVGVACLQVTLRGAGVDGVFGTADDTTATTVTNSNGNYLFSNLAAGQYQVQFGALRAGYAYTRQDAGSNDACDSDANSMGQTSTITLAAGENNNTVDAGIKCVPLGCIGNRVWKDSDADGQQDWFESGVSGVKVTLLGAGWDGQFGTADDTTACTTTNWQGQYGFSNLAAGQYVVHVGNLPSGYVFTGQDRGGNDACDSDVNSLGLSNVIHLGVGQSNQNVDVGIVKASSSWCGPSLSDLLCVDNVLDCYFGSQTSSNDSCSSTQYSYNCDEELRRLTAC